MGCFVLSWIETLSFRHRRTPIGKREKNHKFPMKLYIEQKYFFRFSTLHAIVLGWPNTDPANTKRINVAEDYMKIKNITNTQNAAIYLADKITMVLEELSVELDIPVSILMEDLVPHQPFLIAKMWTEDDGLFNSMKER